MLKVLTGRNRSLVLLAALFAIVSCKKQETIEGLQTNVYRPIAEFTDSRSGAAVAIDFSSSQVTVDLTELRLYQSSVPKQDVVVTVVPDPTVVSGYNTDNGTSYSVFPSSAYTLDQSQVTLTNTDRSKMLKIKLRPSDLLGGDFAIGLKVSEVQNGEPSELYGRILISLAVKNKYDGMYEVTGSCVDAAGIYNGIYPRADVALRTAGLNAVDYLDPDYSVGPPLNNNLYVIENSSTGAPALLFSPRFVFNTTTDKCTDIIDNDSGTSTGVISPSGPNQFTINSPDDKSFVIKYTVFGRFTITENWTYTGPR